MKVLAGVLILVVGALVWSLLSLRTARHALTSLQQSNAMVIIDFSNRWESVRRSLTDQRKFTETLESNLSARAGQLDELRADLATLSADLKKSREETQSAQEEVTKRTRRQPSLDVELRRSGEVILKPTNPAPQSQSQSLSQ